MLIPNTAAAPRHGLGGGKGGTVGQGQGQQDGGKGKGKEVDDIGKSKVQSSPILGLTTYHSSPGVNTPDCNVLVLIGC